MKTNLIVLAAGNSTRFGTANKLLYPIDEEAMILHIFREIKKLSFHRVIVVTQYEEIAKYAKDYGYDIVWNHHPTQGISHSIALGLHKEDVDQYLFLVADQPYTKSTLLQEMLAQSDGKSIICAWDGVHLKNPVLFPNRYRHALLKLQGEQGGKTIVKQHMDEVKTVWVEKRQLQDIDRQEDVGKF